MNRKCIICGSVPWSYYEDFRGNIACSHHNDIKYCCGCGCFVSTSSAKRIYSDEYLCSNCFATHVKESSKENFINTTLEILYNYGFQDIQKDWVQVKLISVKEMKERMPQMSAYGFHTERTLSQVNSRGRFGFDQEVYVLDILPPIIFMEVFAHEILHAWQLQNNLNDYSEYESDIVAKHACEGFANLGSYIIYDYFDSDRFNDDIRKFVQLKKKQMFESRDETYGIPFQKIMSTYPLTDKGRWLKLIKDARLSKIREYVK